MSSVCTGMTVKGGEIVVGPFKHSRFCLPASASPATPPPSPLAEPCKHLMPCPAHGKGDKCGARTKDGGQCRNLKSKCLAHNKG